MAKPTGAPSVLESPSGEQASSIQRLRLSRERRIRRRSDFVRIQGTNTRVVTKHFVFLIARRIDATGFRIGITASRKVGSAVVRNRARRLVREAVRQSPTLFADQIDVVVIVRTGLREMKTQDVIFEWTAVARLLRKRCLEVLAAPTEPQS